MRPKTRKNRTDLCSIFFKSKRSTKNWFSMCKSSVFGFFRLFWCRLIYRNALFSTHTNIHNECTFYAHFRMCILYTFMYIIIRIQCTFRYTHFMCIDYCTLDVHIKICIDCCHHNTHLYAHTKCVFYTHYMRICAYREYLSIFLFYTTFFCFC